MSSFNAKIYQSRRRNLLNQVGDNDIVIVPTSPVKMRNSDVEYQFRSDSDFYYLTGFHEPGAVAVLIPGRQSGEYVMFCRERDAEREMWDGLRAGLDGVIDTWGADDAFPIEDIGDILPGLMEERDKVYMNVGRYPEFDVDVLGWLNKIKQDSASRHAPYELVDLSHLLFEQRLIKGRDEISLMKKAGKISAAGHKRAMQTCRPGMFEYQVQAEMEYEFRRGGSPYNAYSSIVAGGSNACILHYTENSAELKDGDLLLIDAGAEFGCYAADISRTFPVSGRFSAEQRALYDIVLAAQHAAFECCQPGNTWDDPHQAAVRELTQGLIDEKILTGSLEENLEQHHYSRFYMHRTGHWLGLDVHDVGDYRVDNAWRELEPGMAFTVEPGLYIQASDDVDTRWHGIGIRIEDNVVIKRDGFEILTSGVPTAADDIEALMAA